VSISFLEREGYFGQYLFIEGSNKEKGIKERTLSFNGENELLLF
jgi:hypothetical protein